MMDWILDHVPAVLLAGGGLGLVFLAWRFAGFRAALAVLAVIITGGAYRAGRQSGRNDEASKRIREEAKAKTISDEVDNDIGAMPPDAAREALKKWSRD